MSIKNQQAILDKALAAGGRRDYDTALDLLTRLAAEADELPEALLYLGRTRHAMGDYPRALVAIQKYLEKVPDSGEAWFFLGRSFLSAQRPRDALRCLHRATQLGRSNAQSLALRGFAELKLRRPAHAVESLEQAHIQTPNDPAIFRAYRNALLVLAISHLHHGKADSSRQILDFVIKNGGDSTTARLYRSAACRELGMLQAALADLQRARQDNPDDTAIRLQMAVLLLATGQQQEGYQLLDGLGIQLPGDATTPWSSDALERWRALAALQNGQTRSALRSALTLLRKGEKEPIIRVIAAQANFELGRFPQAIEHFKRAAEADPKSSAIRLALALAYWETGQYREARAAAAAAAQRGADKPDAAYLDVLCQSREGVAAASLLPRVQELMHRKPGDRRLMFILAECLFKTGRPDLAGPWFEKLLELDGENDLARLYLIAVAESLGDSRLEMGRYGEYLASYPDNVKIRREYIRKLVANHDWTTALAVLEAGFPYDAASRGNSAILAICYRNTGHYREAAIHYRSLLSADPRNQDYLLALALCLEKSGSHHLAVELLTRGAAYLKTKADAWLALGLLLARQNKVEAACEAFGKAVELAPADPRPLRNLAKLYKKSGSNEMAARYEARAAKLGVGRALERED